MRKALAPLLSVTRRAGLNTAIGLKALVGRRIFPGKSTEPTNFSGALALTCPAETSIVLYRMVPSALACLPHTPANPGDKVECVKSPLSISTMPAPGDFSFVTDAMERDMLADMYRAVTKAEAWDEMKADPGDGGFMYSRSAQALTTRVTAALADPGVHSGASFGFCMRVMQKIARDGWGAYVQARITAASQASSSETSSQAS